MSNMIKTALLMGGLLWQSMGLASDTGWRWHQAPLQPRLGVKLDIASGDRDAGDGRNHHARR